jgi:hypothetical protein
MKLLHDDATRRSLEIFRLYVFGIWFLKVLFEPTHHLAYLPQRIFEPIGVLRFIPPGLYSFIFQPAFLHALKLGILASILVFFSGKLRRASAVTACALLVFHQGFHRGLTFTNHAEMALLYAALIPTLFDLIDPRRKSREALTPGVNWDALPIQVFTAVMCLAYTFIGVHRLVFGGTEIFTSDSLRFWVVQASLPCDTASFDIARLSLIEPLVNRGLNLGFAGTTLFEAASLLCLVSGLFRRAWLVAILAFHLAVHLFMKISFWENTLLLVALVDYHGWIAKAERIQAPVPLPIEPEAAVPRRA